MSEIAISEGASAESEKPVLAEEVKFPPLPDPTDDDFDDDIPEEERAHYKSKFPDLNTVVTLKLHCTACDRHLGSSVSNESRMRTHPMLRTLICQTCHSFYNSGEFDKGEDGSELYCRWCGQGGQVYCCSDCIHVFCAKCIKRNLGLPKIKEIEHTDDWKCFKCNPKCIWDLRATCWALLRFCEQRNKILHQTEDVELKAKYGKAIAIDQTECCKHKNKRKEKDVAKKKEKEKEVESEAKKILTKIPPTIQVKKFASVIMDEKVKIEKKAVKRPASPKNKNTIMIKNPISIAPLPIGGPVAKKFRMGSPNMFSPIRNYGEKRMSTPRIQRPRIITNHYNGFSSPGSFSNMNLNMNNYNMMNNMNLNNMNMNNLNMNMSSINDNINLSLDSLTQGLDLAAVQAMNDSTLNNDDVVCTPDFPLEPLCEVTEDNDDDVQCITPGPPPTPVVALPKVSNPNPPPLAPRNTPMNKGNIIQMTDSDVTVNALTGGLKFRVDPQTLSSNKMYRLPDGRIFAINANPNMPGGYSATIVSQNPDGTPKVTPRSETFAAKLSAVPNPSSPNQRNPRGRPRKQKVQKSSKPKHSKSRESTSSSRECDLKVPVEWYRYNMIDAVDALEYSLSRLHKLKKETTSSYLRTRTVDEMKYLHRTLEQLLTTSSKRFIEIRETLNKEMKTYLSKKVGHENSSEEEDDDVEILPNTENDDPIFIDENSVDSVNDNESQEVDLTGIASSEHNDSAENKKESDPLNTDENEQHSNDITNNHSDADDDTNASALDVTMPEAGADKDSGNGDAKEKLLENNDDGELKENETNSNTKEVEPNSIVNELNGNNNKTDDDETDDEKTEDEGETHKTEDTGIETSEISDVKVDSNTADDTTMKDEEGIVSSSKGEIPDKNDEINESEQDNEKDQNSELSEEMIETLLKDDNLDENASMEMSDLQEAEQILS